ncbi:MAG: hypothetical protein QP733_06290 [Dialister micraerophilus]|uniref:hypothetical protein n=2 Tax=Dialister micraerophilus TaxID=309120 RepID=UPI00254F427C|nr:hypothetical protein [Dialister micraerophilus]MDK8254037.1 hypothetical protein [Dialister micraerophilus]MDK8285248.1 hypothetical protein [Dialister micraerophilus]
MKVRCYMQELHSAETACNIGLTKKFGHSDEEKMIPQRYRSGPISSVYVMQDEVSKLKAENEQQKQEIKELREMVMALMGEKKK